MTPLTRPMGALGRSLAFVGSIAFVLTVFATTALAQDEQLKANATTAAEKLPKQSYRWETRFTSGEVQTPANQNSPIVASGRQGSDGYVAVDRVISNANVAFVTKAGKSAARVGGNWMTLEQAEERNDGAAGRGRGGRGRGGRGGVGGTSQSLSESINKFEIPAAEALALLKSTSGFRSEGNTITATLTSEAATTLFASTNNLVAGAAGAAGAGRGRGRGRGQARGGGQGRRGNAVAPVVAITGTVAFTISDGTLTTLRVSLNSTETLGDEVTRTSRELVTNILEIGATKVDLALDAKEIVDALTAGVVPKVFVAETGFRKLFNGHDLTGWAGKEGFWKVEDGAIVGRSTAGPSASGETSLIARDGNENLKVDNFELRFSYRLTPSDSTAPATASLPYRGQDRGNSTATGYEVNLSTVEGAAGALNDKASDRGSMATQGEVVYWNAEGKKTVLSRLGEARAIHASVKQNDWNQCVIIASDNRIQHFINGVATVDVTDADASHQLRSGLLALNLHTGKPTTAAFKDIRIRQISPLAEAASAVLQVADGFQIEQIYQVPGGQQGSWVAACFDDKGRMIVSDQRGELYRFRLPAIGERTSIKPEPIGLGMGQAHGLLYAFNSLYSMGGGPEGTGLYRIRDTNGDDKYDEARLLRAMSVGSDHSAHVPVLSPDGKSLLVVSGNQTDLTKVDSARVPTNMSEDHLLRRLDTGFASGVLAPEGWIARTDPNGEKWEFVAGGFRNEFDAAFNRDGELFTYDADMEWDIGAPWYRPTRVNHVISGADFGFREGAGKHPDYFFDTFGSVVDIGTGSPTGVTFGYGARFPAKYQEALYICDWSFGKVYAVHLTPAGATYTGKAEPFIVGQPLPVTDVIINPNDGAMYIIVGGRSTQSALYRITYIGDESTEPSAGPAQTQAEETARQARALRKSLETYHGHEDPAAVPALWPHLKSQDRAIRYAARVALEWQPLPEWRERALSETETRTAIAALAALARASCKDQFHRKAGDPGPDAALQRQMLTALNRIDFKSLGSDDRLDLMRTYALVCTRLGAPDAETKAALAAKFDPFFPAEDRRQNFLLSNLLVYLEAPSAATKLMDQIRGSQSQEEQVDYALALRDLKSTWTPALRDEYFRWFVERGGTFRGGNSFNVAMRTMHDDAVNSLTAPERETLAAIIAARPKQTSPQELLAARPVVRKWTLDEVVPVVETGLRPGTRNFEQGRRLYGAVACAVCHRFANEGGATGPELTNLVGRFGVRDLVDSIVNPSKVISDQYGAVNIVTTSGRVITGRIGNMNGNTINIVEDMFNAGRQTGISRDEVESLEPSKLSMMPDGLLNTLTAEEIQDLAAYLYSRGAPDHEYFKRSNTN